MKWQLTREGGPNEGFLKLKEKVSCMYSDGSHQKEQKRKRRKTKGRELVEPCPVGWDLMCKSEGIGTVSSSTV